MKPCLPQHDEHPARRARSLEEAREDYVFDFGYQEIVSAAKVPLRDKSDPRYWLELAKVTAELKVNELRAPKDGDGSPESYLAMYAQMEPPAIAATWERDDVFAWQAVAGTNPIMIRRLEGPLPKLAVTEADVARALKAQGLAGDTLEAALAEGRAYVADYAILEGVAPGTFEGKDKFVFAPIALYFATPKGLRAIAIQCGQEPGPIFTPADGAAWKMARTVVTSADGNIQGIISHFAWCHEVMESVILATHRQLAKAHPLFVLLEPHFANTLITNDIAMTSLIGPDGNMERLQSGTLEASLDLAKRSLRELRLSESAPHEDFAARGVDDQGTLPDYPFRDDGLLSWAPLERWVRAYLRLYYPDDTTVSEDIEVAAWVREMGSEQGGRLPGLSAPETFDALAGLVARILYRCTTFHAAFNYTSFDFFGFAPNMQAAAFGPGPDTAEASEEALRAMWPPYAAAYQGMHLFYTIFRVQLNRIGHYPEGHFQDPRVAPLEAALRRELDEAEATIVARDGERLVPYPYLRPSRVSLSIHV
jgi:arachidonate 15-lipoxygenase